MLKKSIAKIVAKQTKLYVITVTLVILTNILIGRCPSLRRNDTLPRDYDNDRRHGDAALRTETNLYCRRNNNKDAKEVETRTWGSPKDPLKPPFFENREFDSVNKKLDL